MTFIAKRMETPQNDYDTYIGADAIVRFLGKHANIPNCESLKAEYEAKFYTLYRILAASNHPTLKRKRHLLKRWSFWIFARLLILPQTSQRMTRHFWWMPHAKY